MTYQLHCDTMDESTQIPSPEKGIIERILQSGSLPKAVKLFLETTARLSSAASLGFFLLHPGGVNLLSFKGTKPTGDLALKIQKTPSQYKSIKGLQAAFPFVFGGKIFGVLELTYNKPPSTEELENIETLCTTAAAALGAVRKHDSFKTKVKKTITELKNMEKALHESEEKYRNLVERANDGIAIIQDSVFKYVNPRLAEIGDFSVEGLTGTAFTDYIHPDEIPKVVNYYKKRMAGEDVKPIYETVIQGEDNPIFVEINAGITTYEGRPADMVIIRDITERKKMEEDLQKSEEKFRKLFEMAPDAILTVDMEGMITSCNTAAAMTGYAKDEIVGHHFSELKFLQKKNISQFLELFTSLIQGKSIELPEIAWVHKDGTLHVSDVHASLLKETGKSARLLIISRDITEHKEAGEALRKSEEKYRTLIENLNVGIYRVTPDKKGRFIDVNPAFVQILGYKNKEELLKIHVSDTYVNPEDRITFAGKITREGFVRDEELNLKKKDGTPIIVSENAIAVYGPDGTVLYIDGITEDITQRKKVEEQIRTSLKEKEVLLREIHHRVKNNMQIISSLLNLQSKYTEDNQLLEAFKDSQDRIKSMSLIHEKLYQSKDLASIDFDGYIKSLVDNLCRSYRTDAGNISLITDVEDVTLGIDIAIPCGLIINELVSNCLKHAFPDGKGEVKITLHAVNDEMELAVIDNGVGIPDDIDFGTTKTLGLNLVSILAEDQLNGTIELDRTRGTAIRVTFRIE
jgi:PAS domain S-box-containing protein